MPSDTGIRDAVDEAATEDAPEDVRLEPGSGVDVESPVLAYRHDGELVELAERSVPAAAARHGDLE